jgi:4-hydroxybenzoate polyprenyltransferase
MSLSTSQIGHLGGSSQKWGAYFILMRPKHWIKNLFLFIPVFFAGEIFDLTKLLSILVGFFAFSLVASSIYVINDIRDVDADRMHPEKCLRPLAARKVSLIGAKILFVVCLLVGIILSYYIGIKFLFVVSLYFLLNIGYSFGLKDISILDILILSAGFVLRIKAGGVIADVPISSWLNIMVFLLAVFMAIAKRRDDLLLRASTNKDMRKSIKGYNLEFMNICLALVSAVILVAYLMYTISPEVNIRFGTYRLYYTTLFVLAGLMRYLQLTYVEKDSGSPTKLLYKDRFIQITIILWLISFYCLIYFKDVRFFDAMG